MIVDIDEKELAMVILNVLPTNCESIFTKLNVLGDDNEIFSLEGVKRMLLQEELPREMRLCAKDESALFRSVRTRKSSNFSRTFICSYRKRRSHT